jgi:hypothetical protein
MMVIRLRRDIDNLLMEQRWMSVLTLGFVRRPRSAETIRFTKGEPRNVDEYEIHLIPSTTRCYTGASW